MFFVDKDVDDLTGKTWPDDPRIFVTEWYSIENYLVCKDVISRYFEDFVKMRRLAVDVQDMLEKFDERLEKFHRKLMPIMGWIIVMRRQGSAVVLNDLQMGALFSLSDAGVSRRAGVRRLEYLSRVTQTPSPIKISGAIRRVCGELSRIDPKRYVRGKFEVWYLITVARRIITELDMVAAVSGGSISIVTPLNESNVAQLLVRGIRVPRALRSFLDFHLARTESKLPEERPTLLQRMRDSALRFLGWSD